MARSSVFLLAASVWCVLAPGPPGSVAQADELGEADALEFAALPPERDDLGRPPHASVLGGTALDRPTVSPEEEPVMEQELVIIDGSGVGPWAAWLGHLSRAPATLAHAPDLPEYPLVMNSRVRHFLERFTGSRRAVVGEWLARSGRYLGMIRRVFRERGLPEDLAFTAMVESGFDPRAVSPAGATGLWQFMAGTAGRYGLRVDRWVDERLDPEKSTVAAAAYLRDLYEQFGSWKLAQAAYNAGEATVARAVRATGSSDFWALANTRFLMRETKNFVPAVQAATHIGRAPERFGFAVVAHADGAAAADAVDVVRVPPSTRLAVVAKALGVRLSGLRSLNPVLRRPVTPPDSEWELRVPAGTGEALRARLVWRAGTRRVEGSRVAGIHVVRPRETVTSIARRYGVSVADVLRWNALDPDDLIRPGDALRVADLGPALERDGQGGFR